MMARTHAVRNAYESAWERRPNAGEHRERRRIYVARALHVDATNVAALANRALMDTFFGERRYQEAANEFVRLVQQHPNVPGLLVYLGLFLGSIGRAALMDRVMRRVVALDPFSIDARLQRIFNQLLHFGPVEAARRELDESERLGFRLPVLRAELALADRDTVALRAAASGGGIDSWSRAMYTALAAYLEGDFDTARQQMSRFRAVSGYVPHRRRAVIALLERDFSSALDHYGAALRASEQRAFGEAHGHIAWRATFPEFYAHSRYSSMLEEAGLDPASTARIVVPDLPF